MEEDNQNPYYPITDRQRYPSFPPENGEVHARSGQNIDLQFQRHQLQYQYSQLQMQHNNLQTHRLQLHVRRDPIALERISLALNQVHGASLVKHDDDHEAPAENAAPVGGHRYITRSSQKTEPVVKGERKIEPVVKEEPQVAPVVKEEPIEDDHSHLTPDREYAPSSAGFSDEEMEDDDYEPTPAPVAPVTIARSVAHSIAPPATVARHEVKFTVKRDREQNMPIYHRKEFAYCEISMTREEYYHVKGHTYVAPQTLSTPDKNGNTQDRKRLRITWAERDRLNAWRIRHGRNPHEIREGTKYAAARDFWRLNPPLAIEPRKTIEWS
ncbi:hypothetical protein BCON_0119g00090 [Botryotinia convoluta]|uniref:Uncharacterized protein n=1 Tax=Botryotinia convoluta TaxID=54673 RepID=A0A4Z1HWX3_9HELO|nr:hypothetical protein BCON_0119g00090 [Botryotinia convoluta]